MEKIKAYIPKFISSTDDGLSEAQRSNIRNRAEITSLCMAAQDKDATPILKDFLQQVRNQCKNDIFFWLENFAWVYEPRDHKEYPFIPYPFQYDLINNILEHIDTGRDLLIEKSRDMGVTYCVVFVFQWLWQFHDGFSFHIGSKKEDNVDILGDKSTIIGKFRHNIGKQPGFLLPDNWKDEIRMPFLKLINLSNGSQITGESANADFSRSGRYSAILFDEFAFWENDDAAWTAAGDSSPCRLVVSTPNPQRHKRDRYARLRYGGQVDVYSAHWRLHPNKDDEWYDKEKARRTPQELAAELDMCYSIPSGLGCITTFDYVKHISENLNKEYPMIKSLTRVWDIGGTSAVLFCSKYTNIALFFNELILDNLNYERIIDRVIELTNEEFGDWEVNDIGDIALRKREGSNKTITDKQISFIDIARMRGINIITRYRGLVEDGLSICSNKLYIPGEVRIDKKCTILTEALDGSYARKKDGTPEDVHPYSDVADCFRYYIVDNFKPTSHKAKGNRSRGF